MKKCPYCKSDIRRFSSNILRNDIRRHVIKCKTCGKLLRKKISIVLVLEFLVLAFLAANFNTHILFSIATIINALLVVITYCKLPYVPCDEYDNISK